MAYARRYLIALGVALAALTGAVKAQVGAPSQIQQVHFTVFSARPIRDVAFTARSAAAPQKVAFYPTARSPRYEYRGPMPLRFVDSETGEIVAEAVIPSGMRDALLLFSPLSAGQILPGSSLRYQIAVLDDTVGRHGPGGLAIINLSGLELAGTIGKEALTLRPGLNPTLSIGRSAKLMLRTTYKGRSYQSYAATIQLAPKERALLILYPPFNRGSLEVQGRVLLDTPPGPK